MVLVCSRRDGRAALAEPGRRGPLPHDAGWDLFSLRMARHSLSARRVGGAQVPGWCEQQLRGTRCCTGRFGAVIHVGMGTGRIGRRGRRRRLHSGRECAASPVDGGRWWCATGNVPYGFSEYGVGNRLARNSDQHMGPRRRGVCRERGSAMLLLWCKQGHQLNGSCRERHDDDDAWRDLPGRHSQQLPQRICGQHQNLEPRAERCGRAVRLRRGQVRIPELAESHQAAAVDFSASRNVGVLAFFSILWFICIVRIVGIVRILIAVVPVLALIAFLFLFVVVGVVSLFGFEWVVSIIVPFLSIQ